MNKVIAGDYKGQGVMLNWKTAQITLPLLKVVKITKETVEEYEVLNSNEHTSTTSAIGRAAVGAFFLGPIGLAAGMGAKKKGTYHVAIQFKDGKRSLLEVDSKIFKAITISLF